MLTGDWLAELTMLILARQRMKHGAGTGYARTFLTQMEQVLGTCLDRGIKVVTNAGGLDPAGAAAALREKADELGLGHVRIAYVDGRRPHAAARRAARGGRDASPTSTPARRFESLGMPPLTANAYLGGRGITAALAAGADVVITGRVTDAALVDRPGRLVARLVVRRRREPRPPRRRGGRRARHRVRRAGHRRQLRVLPARSRPRARRLPVAEVADDGSSVITKHDGTGGLVSVGTVTAQLLYEIGGPAYANPDVTARFDTIELDAGRAGPRAHQRRARRRRRPSTLKVAVNTLGGFRNTMSLVLTGLDIEAKADLALRTVAGVRSGAGTLGVAAASSPRRSTFTVRELHVALLRHDRRRPGDDRRGARPSCASP